MPLIFDSDILRRDFPGRIIELQLFDRIGRDGWSFDPEEPRYVSALGEAFILYDRYFGRLYSVDIDHEKATLLLSVPEGEARHVIGIDAGADGKVLVYTRAHFYRSGIPEPIKNLTLAESAVIHGEGLVVINNPDVAHTENQLLLTLDRNGMVREAFGEYNFSTAMLGEKYNHHIRMCGDKAVIWNSDFAEVSRIDLGTHEQHLLKLNHPILLKRGRINSGEYFTGMNAGSHHMLLPVIEDISCIKESLFALLNNESIGLIAELSTMGEVERIYTFPLAGPSIALDFAAVRREAELVFCVIVARGQRLSALLYSAPAARENSTDY